MGKEVEFSYFSLRTLSESMSHAIKPTMNLLFQETVFSNMVLTFLQAFGSLKPFIFVGKYMVCLDQNINIHLW